MCGWGDRSQVLPLVGSRPRLMVAERLIPAFDSPRKQSSLLAPLRTATKKKTPHKGTFFFGSAGGENRTPVLCLEGRYSTTKLHPHSKREENSSKLGLFNQ